METAGEIAERSPTVAALLAEGGAALTAAGVSSARLDAEVLLATACAVDRTALYVRANQAVAPAAQHAFRALLARRLRREPLQYIVGRQEFWSLDFVVTPAVLIPRPETELLVELALELFPPSKKGEQGGFSSPPTSRARSKSPLPPLFEGGESENGPLTICDLGTGSGCIAVALARELPYAEIWAVDQSAAALAVARANACRHRAERIRFVAGDLFAPLTGVHFDLIVCNPPYIATRVLEQLQPELAWEPPGALDGGSDGLEIIRRVVAAAPAHLVSGGWLVVEIGADQRPAVLELAQATGFQEVSVRDDYAGCARVLLARCSTASPPHFSESGATQRGADPRKDAGRRPWTRS
jgi:release factor glutamine methyltransferase